MTQKTLYIFSLLSKKNFIFEGIFLLLFMGIIGIHGQSLWEDHNPYTIGSNLPVGTVLKLNIDEPVQIVYQYENVTDENVNINLVPDRMITKFLPPATTTRNISKRYQNRLNSRSRVRLKMAVTVDTNLDKNSISFKGAKFIAQENGVSRQQVDVQGKIHVDDIEPGRLIRSENVADLQIILVGAPIPKNKNLKPPPVTKEEATSKVNPITGETLQNKAPAASLSDDQKRQLIWEYINRLLGESSNQ